MRTRFRVTGVVQRDHKMLMIHRFRHGEEYWVFPGGGVEEGESWEEGLQREMLEETSLALLKYQFLFESTEEPGCIFYHCELESGEPRLGGPELQEQSPENQHILEWVGIEDLFTLQKVFPRPDPRILSVK